ncbi:hypothetical protein K227x_29050 [Rubripirellula lacrimiformis]|uniref:Uncharacterized protein n=1 Tax=Rubripirellula lacrimiformis TaxID=1930273 RepID=A0A517NBL4_9BACT|nr:hypothetical protein [Rubripirellula lacrimiformis]QDT04513.1 hypothetical protein K227x_29050 [Rubripirellula lacrimiformis]
MNESLLYRIRPVTRRMRGLRFWQIWAVAALLVGGVGWALHWQAQAGTLDGRAAAYWVGSIAIGIAVTVAVACAFLFRDPRFVARKIEQHFPSLDQRLLTALSQSDNQLGYLQQRIVKEARDHSREFAWVEAVPASRMWIGRLGGLGATAILAGVLGSLAATRPNQTSIAAANVVTASEPVVEPGDVSIERGTSLVVTARFGDSSDSAESVQASDQGELLILDKDGQQRVLPMTQSLDDPILGGYIGSVDQPVSYQVRTPYWTSPEYKIDVFDFPAMKRSDADLVYPDYTGMEPKHIEDAVRVSAVVGTDLTWHLRLNKPVSKAELVDEDGNRTPLEFDADQPDVGHASFAIADTRRYELQLVDDDGRSNKFPPKLVVRALPNLPPKLKVTPASDTEVSALEEFPLQVELVDDFGVGQVGLVYSLSGGEPSEIILGHDLPRGAKTNIEQLVAMEDLQAEPDQLLAYHFFATDVDPEGKQRRTESDMYFAEVRPFDQIFRQGDPPPGGEPSPPSPQAAEAEELAELQKQIIAATWRVVRGITSNKGDDALAEPIDLLIESQGEAMEKLDELAEEIRDPASQAFITEVRESMSAALAELTSAKASSNRRGLATAVPHQQAAYGGLLKLRAREFEVSRSKQQPSQGQSSASQKKRQQQLDDLELEEDENRYETQSQAQPASAEEQAAREVRQTLSRLRELARRQEDINKELAQLQTALEDAKTEQEREAVERQLERLRDQQVDLLRETDELDQSMGQPESEMAGSEAQADLQSTRDDVQQAAKALEEQDVAQALASGKRAERQFEELRDEFRQSAAGQFSDAMREMRNAAQELDQRQQELQEQLSDRQAAEQRSGSLGDTGLRGESADGGVEAQLAEQRESLGELLDQMQETVTEAEEAEPLLAQGLYDSYRKASQRGIDRKLAEASALSGQGMKPEAAQAARQAGEGVKQLREELERAADDVLGDETQALQRALSELEKIDQQLQNELNDNRPAGSPPGDASQGAPSSQPDPNSPAGASPGESPAASPGQPQGTPAEGGQGQSPSQSRDPAQNPSQGEGEGERQGQGQPQGEGQGQSPASQSGEGGGPSPGQPSDGDSQNQPSGSPPPGGAGSTAGQPQPGSAQPGSAQPGSAQPGASASPIGGFGGRAANAPLTGDGYREWSDSLREIEEMVDDPDVRSQAARIRDRAREIRIDFRRNSKEPEWDLVDEMVATPLRELKRNVSEELIRRSADKNAIVPIDRDPVPREFSDAVRLYYERIGSGQ